MVKLSIIVPYYETYELTERLVESLVFQKNDNVEIILIDDYCKKEFYKHKDLLKFNNIKLIEHEKNIGVSKSRNEGIRVAQGKYVGFIDCDDMITDDYINTLVDAIRKYDTDVINFNWIDMNTNKVHTRPKNFAPWKAIYKKETMPIFKENMKYGSEDVFFQADIEKGIENKKYTITYLDRTLYLYNSNRIGSLMWKKTHKEGYVMKYIIMCGGNYKHWEKPRQLSVVNNEVLLKRTIRLLRKNGIKDIAISSNNPVFEEFGVPMLKHDNLYEAMGAKIEQGDWFNCFYPTDNPVCYIFGDVYFSEEAIKTIVETETDDIEFFASKPPFAKNYIKTHEEPFALKVVNQKHLKEALKKTRELDKKNKFWRKPIMWELWTVIKDAPLQTKPGEYTADYIVINDYTCDIDKQEDAEKLNAALDNKKIRVKAIKNFTLKAFNEISEIVRADRYRNEQGHLYSGDTFCCDIEMAKYLTGDNANGNIVVEIIEITPIKKDQ